ncbi:type IV pilin [Methanocorpusculum sp. GPch4]|uniref:type IV pilin n=1 Tax=Methanocorpusculum sp. GPch4 TaxID=2527877 RepID=UPI001432D18B|nr:type IV pilin N-terminal domain-containing protein [Methanocorpusculum sp. GPch4]
MKVSTKKNDGVSPVIGTILLVAITVVLVAIISAVVMGMTGGIGTSHVVGVKVVQGDASNTTASSPGASLLVTITGGDTTGLTNLTVYNGSNLVNVSTATPSVGQPISFQGTAGNASKLNASTASISVVGTFPDGNQTIYTGTINLI